MAKTECCNRISFLFAFFDCGLDPFCVVLLYFILKHTYLLYIILTYIRSQRNGGITWVFGCSQPIFGAFQPFFGALQPFFGVTQPIFGVLNPFWEFDKKWIYFSLRNHYLQLIPSYEVLPLLINQN